MQDDDNVTAPWTMCGREEAREREIYMEVSDFEATAATCDLPPKRRTADPRLCVQKYRRSAAGGGSTLAATTDRPLAALDATVTHLLRHVLCRQRSHHPTPRSLYKTSVFVDDRLRAVQVDYVRSHSGAPHNTSTTDVLTSLRFLARMIRYNLLIGYLLTAADDPVASSGLPPPPPFEHKFNAHALQSSLANFFHTAYAATSNGQHAAAHDHRLLSSLDEIMCYASLLHTCSLLLQRETGFDALPMCGRTSLLQDGSSSGVLAYADLWLRLHAHANNSFPKWRWSLELVAAADSGNYVKVLNMLDQRNDDDDDDRWSTLARCCLSPALPVIRLGLLRQYNKSFGKAEKVTGTDLARLLHTPTPDAALAFCEAVGLPLHRRDLGDVRATFKVAPIAVENPRTMFRGRSDDAFVFGDAKWRSGGRTDEDGVFVVSESVLWSFLR